MLMFCSCENNFESDLNSFSENTKVAPVDYYTKRYTEEAELKRQEEQNRLTENNYYVTPVVSTKPDHTVTVTGNQKAVPKDELKKLESLIASYRNVVAIYIKNKNDDMTVAVNEDYYIHAASIVKLPFAYYAYTQIESGAYSLNDTMVYEEKYRRPGTGIMKTFASGGTYTIEYLLFQSINCSDNTAYFMLLDYFGVDGYNDMLRKCGFVPFLSSKEKYGDISARCLATFWDKFYQKESDGDLWSKAFRSFNTTFSPIRNALNSNDRVCNKSGWDNGGYHDTGIVYTYYGNYILVVMTNSDGDDYDIYYVNQIVKAISELMDSYNK